ncbi:hypothetical protein PACTADRAFT_78066 [Pachysolen tannophilus NRRL Y-2460]|uniref:WDR5-like beta-propeller domain-containing protein n=1 Tax=Pachysolen tannophilus NRRL Y-2460 TaxID=669874 RepID=A0A1E4U0T3_PACTA|nr:hypothetical protein PACTADRAFT_78066 [Pachysolen tannophilus NRRL Y-2460]
MTLDNIDLGKLYIRRYSLDKIHDEFTTSVKLSPNGKYIATGSSDKLIKIWDLKTGNFEKSLKGHSKGVSDICWSPDSKYIASASDDETIIIWSVEYGKCIRILKGHTYHITCLEFNYKGNLLISGSSDEAIRIWDVLRGKCLKTLSAHSDPISSLDVSWDGTIIVSASFDGLIRLFDTESGQCLKTLIYEYSGGSSFPVSYVRFSPNGKYILASTLDGSIRLWDYMNNKVVKTFIGEGEQVKNDDGNNDGSKGSGLDNMNSKILKTKKTIVCEKYTCGTRFITSNEYIPLIASGSDNGNIYIWNLQTKEILNILKIKGDEHQKSPVLQIDTFDGGKILAAVSMNGNLEVWDLNENFIKSKRDNLIANGDLKQDTEDLKSSRDDTPVAVEIEHENEIENENENEEKMDIDEGNLEPAAHDGQH